MTIRQRSVLELISVGLRDKQIASLLGVSVWTIKDDVRAALKELEARSRTQAVAVSIRAGAIS